MFLDVLTEMARDALGCYLGQVANAGTGSEWTLKSTRLILITKEDLLRNVSHKEVGKPCVGETSSKRQASLTQ